MNAKEFFDKVSEMRQAQKAYFKMRTSTDLRRCKQLEKEIDQEIERVSCIIREREQREPTLFG